MIINICMYVNIYASEMVSSCPVILVCLFLVVIHI
jgi:hypothetical protein